MSPDLETWRKLLVRQLDKKDLPNIQKFYETYSENQMFIILAHELTHHLNLFLDEFDDAEAELVKAFKGEYGNSPLKDFGSSSYQGSLSSIKFDYWGSFLTVKYLVEVRANQDVKLVFDEYHKWNKAGRKIPLIQYFDI